MTTQDDDELAALLDKWCAKPVAALAGMSLEAKSVLAERMGLPLAELLDDDSGDLDERSTATHETRSGFDLASMTPAGTA